MANSNTKCRLVLLLVAAGLVGFVSAMNPQHAYSAKYIPREVTPELAAKIERIRQLSPNTTIGTKVGVDADICWSDECIDGAIMMLESINWDVNPCTDFYQFSCGKWLKENQLPPASSRYSRFNALRDEVNEITSKILDPNAPEDPTNFAIVNQAREYYKQCLDEGAQDAAGLDPLMEIIDANGGWPVTTVAANPWDPDGFEMINTTAEYRRRFLDSYIYRILVSEDIKDTSKRIIYIDQPGFFLPKAVLDDAANNGGKIEAYKNFFEGVVKVFQPAADDTEVTAAFEEMLDFEKALSAVAAPDEVRSDTTRLVKVKLQTFNDDPEWMNEELDFISAIEQVFSSSGITVDPEADVFIYEKDYLKALKGIIAGTSKETIANYVQWRLVAGLAGETTKALKDLRAAFDTANTGASPATRAVKCSNAALSGFGMAIGTKYIDAAGFSDETKANVDLMVENLRVAFDQLLAENQWMSDDTKPKASAKAKAMRQFMAYPEWLRNETRVEQEYAGLNIDKNALYLKSVEKLSNWMGDETLKTLVEPTDKNYWLTYPGVVNAFYSPEFNSITFPAGILQPPFYRGKGIESVNYGGIGVVIGHEITHGFDDSGSQYDGNGNAEDWWTPEDKGNFTEKADCIVKQYGSYKPEKSPGGLPINGDLTSGENIADNGGIRQAHRAYRNWVKDNNNGVEEPRLPGLEMFNSDQMFFLGYANIWCENITPEALDIQLQTDPHSPAEFRVIGGVVNSDLFARRFSCRVGSPMNPAPQDHEKCVLW